MAHDYRVMVDNPKSILSMTEINFGIPIPMYLVKICQVKLPPRVWHDILGSGVEFSSADGIKHQFIDRICPKENLIEEAIKLGGKLKKITHKPIIASIRRSMYPEILDACGRGVLADKEVIEVNSIKEVQIG